MILFKKIRYRNILSTGKVFMELDLDSHQTTLIIGKNGNGKSTLIDALFFVLYGKPYRKINKPQLVNSVNKKDLLVELEFEASGNEYLIRRGIKPNVFEIFCDGTLIDQSAKMTDYQDILEQEILKLDAKSFRKIIVLAKTDYVPYMQLPADQRRSFTEDLLDLKIFSVMNKLLKERISKNKTAISDIQKEIEFSERLIQNIEKNIREREEDNSELLQTYKDKIAENKTAGKKLLEEIEPLAYDLVQKEIKLEEKNKLSETKAEIQIIKRNNENKIISIEQKISFYTDHDDCSECGQHIDTEFKKNFIEEQQKLISKCENNISELDIALEKLNTKIIPFLDLENVIVDIENKLRDLRYQIKNLGQSTESLQEYIAQIEKKKEEINQDELIEAKKKLNEDQKKYQDLHKEKENLDVLALLLKDGGLKSKIIKKYIPIINQYVSKYLEMLDFFVLFELNEDFEETIKSRFRDTFSYSSFSEGEKLKIDTSLLFAFRAVARMRNNNDSNLLILDETFDASLDKDGVDLLLNLIKEDQRENNVIVISHNTDDMQDSFERTLVFRRDGNFSYMEELT